MKTVTNREISINHKPYIVAELNSSHRGDINIAKRLIDEAKKCGCDAVKFQSWSKDSLYCSSYYKDNPLTKRIVDKLSLTPEQLYELSVYCKESCIDFSSTPYSYEEVDFLIDKCKADFVKIASMDINNVLFLNYVAKKQYPVVLSTGMATMDEIEKAVSIFEKNNSTNICILHCVSIYPVEEKNVNLNNIMMLKKSFPNYEIGYSDHTTNSIAACASVVMGASLIEKHFTLDNSKIGWDNQMATEPDDMEKLIKDCNNTYCALGQYDRVVSEDEKKQRVIMRRSLIANKDLPQGHILTIDDLDAKRPGTGIPVDNYDKVLGRTLAYSIMKDEMLKEEYLL